MTQGTREISKDFFEATVRIEQMHWLAAISTAVPDEFRDFCADGELRDSKRIMATFPWLAEELDTGFLSELEDRELGEEIVCELGKRGHFGFFVQLARPIPSEFGKDGKSHSYSWGHYQTEWFYFDGLEEILPTAKIWSDEIVARERAKALARTQS